MSGVAGVAAPRLPTRRLRELRGHTAPLQVVAWTPDGRYALTGGQDRTICLWNPFRAAAPSGGGGGGGDADTGGLLIRQYRGHGYEVVDVAVARDNARFVSCGGDKCALVWDTASGAVARKVWGHDARINSVALNDEATVLFTASDDRRARAWDLRAAARAPLQVWGDATDNATKVLVAGDAVIVASLDGCVRTYDLRAARAAVDELAAPVTSLALSRDGHCLLAASTSASGGSLALLERAGGALLVRYAGAHTNALYRTQPALTSDDAAVIAPSEDGGVAFYDLVDGRVLARLPAAHRRVVACVAPHPSPLHAGVMATASFDGTAALWCAPGSEEDCAALVLAGGSAEELGLLEG